MKKETEQSRFEVFRFFRLTFPDHADLPAEQSQLGLQTLVAGLVAAQFATPEAFILLGPGLPFVTGMPMPEAAMDEEDEGSILKHKIRSTGKMGDVGFIGETPAIQKRFNLLLRSRVTSLNTPHAGQSLLASHDVAHKDSLPPHHQGRP